MPERAVKLSLDLSLVRSKLGLTAEQLPDDATDEQINEVLTKAGLNAQPAPAAAATPPAATTPATTTPEGTTPEGTPEATPSAAPAAAAAAPPAAPRQMPGGIVIDSVMWEQTQSELAVVRAEREKRELNEDQDFLRLAVKAGKVPPTRIDHYMQLMKADRDGTREFIDGLPESLPMHEYGSLGELDDALKASDYPEQWLSPTERRRVKAAQAAYAEGRVGDVEPGAIVREA